MGIRYLELDREIHECGHIRKCRVCGGYYDIDDMERLPDGTWVCEDCYAELMRVYRVKELRIRRVMWNE